MRSLIALLFLAACSQQPPQAELAGGEPNLDGMTYHCTEDGREFVRFEYNGGSEDRFTDRACDYDAWRADVEANGPIYSRRTMNYEEWLRRRSPDA